MRNFEGFYQGESAGKRDQQGFYELTNVDVHSELGVVKNQFALTTVSETPNEKCISEAVGTDVFFFSTESGKVWKCTSNDTCTLVHTNTQGNNRGASAFNGYLYYATDTKLGRIAVANASSEASWSSHTDAWQSFTYSTSYRPMFIIGLQLFIGDKHNVSYVDHTGAFEVDGLDTITDYVITAFGEWGGDLAIGATGTKESIVYLWDTFSPSWTLTDVIPETPINCFIDVDGILLLSAGTSNIYQWTGGQASMFKKILNANVVINHYNTTSHKGRPLFATGNKIYSIFRVEARFPLALVCEYTASSTIQSIVSNGTQLYVSSDKIEKIGTSYAVGTIITPLVRGTFRQTEVLYYDLAEGATIGISTNKNNTSFVEQTPRIDTIHQKVFFDGQLGQTNSVMVKITMTGYSEIENIIVA
jgi:hypothetical protein